MVAVAADKVIKTAKDHPRTVVGTLGVIGGITAMVKGGPKVKALTVASAVGAYCYSAERSMRPAWFS